jgi:hypothetical protein
MAALKDGENVVGNRTKIKIVKNKVAAPFREAEVDILFGEGVSREGGLLDLGVAQGLVEKSGSWFSFGGERIGQGREKRPRVPGCESRHAQPPGWRSAPAARPDRHRRDRAHVRQDRIISAFESRPRSRKPVSSGFGDRRLKKTEENGDFVLLFSLLPLPHLV